MRCCARHSKPQQGFALLLSGHPVCPIIYPNPSTATPTAPLSPTTPPSQNSRSQAQNQLNLDFTQNYHQPLLSLSSLLSPSCHSSFFPSFPALIDTLICRFQPLPTVKLCSVVNAPRLNRSRRAESKRRAIRKPPVHIVKAIFVPAQHISRLPPPERTVKQLLCHSTKKCSTSKQGASLVPDSHKITRQHRLSRLPGQRWCN